MQLLVYKFIVIGEIVTIVRGGDGNAKVVGAGALKGLLAIWGIFCCFVHELRFESEKN